jgi:(p)ppGpp synthase/HD superfamily hydrolase
MTNADNIIRWAKHQHSLVNQKYGGDGVTSSLPYGFHLDMVIMVARKYIHLIPEQDRDLVIAGCACHDLLEDCHHLTYGSMKEDLKKTPWGDMISWNFVHSLADLSFALASNTGKTRKERLNEAYYEKLKSVKYAVFIKLCDRIANILYGTMFRSSMLEKYRKENVESFLPYLNGKELLNYMPMVNDLNTLLETQTYSFE